MVILQNNFNFPPVILFVISEQRSYRSPNGTISIWGRKSLPKSVSFKLFGFIRN